MEQQEAGPRPHGGVVVPSSATQTTSTAPSSSSIRDCREVLKNRLERGHISWSGLPSEFQNDLELAQSLTRYPDADLAWAIMEKFPVLRGDADVWWRILEKIREPQDLSLMVERYAPAETILANQEFMIQACRKWRCVRVLPPTLSNRRDFWKALLQQAPVVLGEMPPELQRRFPDLVVETWARLGQWECLDIMTAHSIGKQMVPEIWETRANVLAWFRAGLPFLVPARSVLAVNPPILVVQHQFTFPTEWKNDQEIFQLIARHGSDLFRWRSFSQASITLRGDKDFMLQVLEHDPSLLIYASEPLQQDTDIQLVAFGAATVKPVEVYLRRSKGRPGIDWARAFLQHTERLLTEHQVFLATVLMGMSPNVVRCSESTSTLTMLDQGNETSVSLKKRVAEYLGIPTGKKLRQLRQARQNLSQALARVDRGQWR